MDRQSTGGKHAARGERNHPEVFAFGQTNDIAAKAGVLEQLALFQSELATAEAEVAFTLHLGSGPWLFLVAEK